MANPNLPAINPTATDEWTAALQAAGYLTASLGTGQEYNRIKVVGSTLTYDGTVIASYNAKTKEPAMIVQIIDQPKEYQAKWFDEDGRLARAVNRPEIAGKMCRSHFDEPAEARKFAQDGTSCDTCPVHPFMPKDQLPAEADNQRCSWKADIEFRILDQEKDGSIKATDETVYTLSLPTTGVIEFKGSNSKKSNAQAGSVSDHNFMVKLARLGFDKWGADGLSKAITALRLGGVIAELRILPASNDKGNINWNVVSFNPIDVAEQTEQPAITTTEPTLDTDTLPF